MVLEKAQKTLEDAKSFANKFESSVLRNTKVEKAWVEKGRVFIMFSVRVSSEMCNRYDTLHGGAITTLIDEVTVAAVKTQDRQPRRTLSTDLAVSLASAALVNDELRVVAKCDKVGRSLAFASAEIFAGDRLVATGRQTLYMVAMKPESPRL